MKSVTGAAIALLMGAMTPAFAQAPAPAGPPRVANVPGVSAAGNAVLTKFGQRQDPAAAQLVNQLKGVVAQVALLVQAPTLDVDKFAALLKQRASLQAQLAGRSDEHVITILRALPANDRVPFLKALSAAGQQHAAAAAPH